MLGGEAGIKTYFSDNPATLLTELALSVIISWVGGGEYCYSTKPLNKKNNALTKSTSSSR